MNKFIAGISLLTYLLTFNSCSKYDPIYGVAGNTTFEPLNLKMDMVYIHDNDIYITNEILSSQEKLTNSPSDSKTHIAFSPQHDKIAYLNGNGTPVILDDKGVQLEILSQYSNVSDIGWHSNGGNPTLYILVNNDIEFHGQALNLVPTPFDFVFPLDVTNTIIDAIDIDDNLNIAFSYRYEKPYAISLPTLSKYYYGAGVQYSSVSQPDVYSETYDYYYSTTTSSYAASPYKYYYSVNFNELDNNVNLGKIVNGEQSNYNYYSLHKYNLANSTTNSFVSDVSSGNYFVEKNEGRVASNIYEIVKYLDELPANVPPPNGTPNTFRLNFNNSNNNCPTYFDWQP